MELHKNCAQGMVFSLYQIASQCSDWSYTILGDCDLCHHDFSYIYMLVSILEKNIDYVIVCKPDM